MYTVDAIKGYWTTRGYANSRIANSRTGRLTDWTSRGLVNSRTSQLAYWTFANRHAILLDCIFTVRFRYVFSMTDHIHDDVCVP